MKNKVIAGVLCFGFVACGAPVDDDGFESDDQAEAADLGTSAQALSSSCGTATPDYTYTGHISPDLITNSGSGCTQIVDINNIDLTHYLPPILSPNQYPATEADCVAARARMYIWDKTAAGTPVFLGSSQLYGIWQGSMLGCALNMMAPGLTAGRSYRFGVSTEMPAFTYINMNFRSVSNPH